MYTSCSTDGIEACIKIQQTQKLPIITLSANGQELDKITGLSNTLMVHIRKIREKIEANPRKPQYLKTVWGVGYKLEKGGSSS